MTICQYTIDFNDFKSYNMTMRFGVLLGQLRQKSGISQKELAKRLAWDQSYLSKIESGQRKPPSRDMLIAIARIINLTEDETDELLLSVKYQPQSIIEMNIDDNDFSLKKHVGVLADIRNEVPLSSYIRAKEEITDFLELMRIKYLQKIDNRLMKNTLLADFIYSKVKRGGLKALYQAINQPQGGAVVIQNGKILLAPIGISPLKDIWHIPAGFVNPKKGDNSAQDIAIRLVKRYLNNAEVEVVKELTAEGEVLEGIDTTNESIQFGHFPAVFQAFEIKLKEKKIKISNGANFFNFQDIPKLKGGIHPLLSQIIKPFVKDKKIVQSVYQKGQETIKTIIKKKNYKQNLKQFYFERIKKNLK